MPKVGSRHLSPCPVCPHSPDGYLYEREAILEYILHQKKEIARQMKVMGRGGGGTGEGQADLMLSSQAEPPWASFLSSFSL